MLRSFARLALPALLASCTWLASAAPAPADNGQLAGGFRNPAKAGWIFVHLQGTPRSMGYQHGYLLAPEIEDAKRAIELSLTHDVKHTWNDLRAAAKDIFWPGVPDEYRQELQGIVAGLHAHGSTLDLLDLVAMNANMEFAYYYGNLDRRAKANTLASIGEHCSAFVATGAYTKDGRIVIGHNNWSDYLTGSRWKVIFDVAPQSGRHFIMDGVPGLIHSADDFGINDAGILITETTIGGFHGFNEKGIPEFARARKAMQYAESIDDFARIMEQGNNGGYANTWLIGDRKNNEIARLEVAR